MRYAGERVEEPGDRVGTVEARRPAGKEDEGTVWGEAVRGGGGVRLEARREQLSEAVAGLRAERRGAVAERGAAGGSGGGGGGGRGRVGGAQLHTRAAALVERTGRCGRGSVRR